MSAKIKAITNETEKCQICGRTDLKKVAVLAILDADGNEESVIFAGTTCAARAIGITVEVTSFEQIEKIQKYSAELASVTKRAEMLSEKYNDDIAIIKDRTGKFYTARGRAFDANPGRYGTPVRWINR